MMGPLSSILLLKSLMIRPQTRKPVNLYYTLVLKDTNNDMWDPLSNVEISALYGNIIFKTFLIHVSEETFRISAHYAIEKLSTWKLTSGNIDASWKTPSFNDASWDTVVLDNVAFGKTGTQYFRKAFTGLSSFAAIEARFNYRAGIIAYINGVEIYRDNMDAGEVTSSTPATGAYPEEGYHGVVRSSRLAETTSSMMAVELHYQVVTSTNAVTFDMFLAYLISTLASNTCFFLPYPLSVSGATDASLMTDWDPSTFGEASLPATFTLTPSVFAAVNGIRILADDFPYGPASFTLSGSNSLSATTWTPILAASDVTYTSDTVYSMFPIRTTEAPVEAYKYYRHTITVTNDGEGAKINENQLLVCNFVIPIVIDFEKSVYACHAYYETIVIRPISRNIVNCTILSGTLPAGLTLNMAICVISGRTGPVATTVIGVTGSYSGAIINGSFSLTVTECTTSSLLVRRSYKFQAEYEVMVIRDDDTEQVLLSIGENQGQVNNMVVDYYICTAASAIYIVLSTSSVDWYEDSFIQVFSLLGSPDDKEELLKGRYSSTLGVGSSYSVIINHQVNPQQGWYYKMGSVDANWYSSDMSSFTQGVYNAYPASTNQIQLYKKTFQVSSITDMSAVVMNIKYKYGCVVYLNGNEVFRNGVTGTLSTSSLSGNTYAELQYHSISVPLKTFPEGTVVSRNNVNVGANTIAIALVAAAASNTAATFDATLRLAEQEFRVLSMTATASGMDGEGSYPFSLSHTLYISGSTCSDNNLLITLNDDRREWVSQLLIQTYYDSLDEQAHQLILEGRNANEDWTVLKTITGLTYTIDGEKKSIWLTGNNKAYNQFRFRNIGTGISSSCSWRVQRLDLLTASTNVNIPALTYPATEIYKDIEMAEVYPNSEMYTDFSVNPSLPTGISLNANTGVISGTATAITPTATYTITATSILGSIVNVPFQFTVGVCAVTKSLITFTIRGDSYLQEMSFKLFNGRTTEGTPFYHLTTFPVSNQIFYLDFCLNHAIYTAQALDYYSDGWNTLSGYMLTVDIGTLRFENNMVPSTMEDFSYSTTVFSSFLPFQIEYSDWKVFQGDEVATGWKGRDFDDAAWSTMKAAAIPTTSSVTTYIRKTISIDNVNDYQVINARMRYTGGVVVYFNGEIVARFNLPAVFDKNTEGLTPHDGSVFSKFHIILPMHGLVAGTNVVAFEIHRAVGESSSSPVVFDATGVFGVETCSLVSDSIIGIETNGIADGIITDAFDGSVFTSASLSPSTGVHVTWSVENLEGSVFNSFGMYTGLDTTIGFSLYGQFTNEEESYSIFAKPDVEAIGRERNMQEVFGAFMSFNSFKYEHDTAASGQVGIQDYVFAYCKAVGAVCARDGEFPSVGNGQQSPAKCVYGFRGYRYRECMNGVFGEIQNSLCDYKSPENVEYEKSNYIAFKDVAFVSSTPTYDNIVTKFYIREGTLPKGLTINETTGVISGTPTELSSAFTYTIIASNPKHLVEVTVDIIVISAYCPAEGDFERTDVGKTAVYQCSKKGAYVGTTKRECSLGATGGVWGPSSGFCLSIVTIIIVIIVLIVVILVVVFIIIRTSSKKKAVGGVKGKKGSQGKATIPKKEVKKV